jgi:hypothetical protein
MRIKIKYYLVDGINETPLSEDLTWWCDVKTFSDYHDKFSIHCLKHHNHFYIVIKDLKVIDL